MRDEKGDMRSTNPDERATQPPPEQVLWTEFQNDGSGSRHYGEGKEGVSAKYGVDEEFDKVFDATFVPAHANKELVFNYHDPDEGGKGTLVTADLLFNLPAKQQYEKSPESATTGILTRLFTLINGTGPSQIKWQRYFIWYAISAGDRKGFGKSVKEIEGWSFDRIVPCHGNVVRENGRALFRSVFDWHLSDGKKGA